MVLPGECADLLVRVVQQFAHRVPEAIRINPGDLLDQGGERVPAGVGVDVVAEAEQGVGRFGFDKALGDPRGRGRAFRLGYE